MARCEGDALIEELQDPSERHATAQGPFRARRAAVAALGVLGLGLVAIGVHQIGSSAARKPFNGFDEWSTIIDAEDIDAEHDSKDDSKDDSEKCAANNTDCTSKKCCRDPGLQCYKKEGNWSQCRASCNPGPDPIDLNRREWTCKELGPRTPGKAGRPSYELSPAKWVQDFCAGPGDNCNVSKCCKEPGKQCYSKVKGWAACKAECVPGGPDPVDANSDPWECKKMGMRTPGASKGGGVTAPWVAKKCSDHFENCKETKCCKDPGHMCFKKTEAWSMCRPKCIPGPLLTDRDPVKWNCTKQGGRTPGIPQNHDNGKVADWVKEKCSKDGEDCTSTMCCSTPTRQCYKKNNKFATCMKGCETGVHKDDKDGGKWSCDKLGTRTPRPWGSPSLYCFHVAMVNSYEADNIRQEITTKGGIGIFSCELYDVFSQDGEVWLGDGPLGQVRTHYFKPAPVGRSVDGTAGNTALFMNVWAAVHWVGRYALTDWTIKVDPDAVMFASRLRGHLAAHTNQPAYIVNCNKGGLPSPMMFGSLEAVSRKGLQLYYDNEYKCKNGYQYGEDRWLGGCLASLGAQGVQDFGLVGDNVCTGANCFDGKAAYHPFKNPGSWMQCWNNAVR